MNLYFYVPNYIWKFTFIFSLVYFFCTLPLLEVKDLCSDKSRNGWDQGGIWSLVFGPGLLKVFQQSILDTYYALHFLCWAPITSPRAVVGGWHHKSQQKISHFWDHSTGIGFTQCTWREINTKFAYKRIDSEMTIKISYESLSCSQTAQVLVVVKS